MPFINPRDLLVPSNNPADITLYVQPDRAAPDLDLDLYLAKGRYRFTFSKPVPGAVLQSQIEDELSYFDTNGDWQEKRYTIDSISYSVSDEKLYVDVTIIDNPIWLPIVYAAIWGAVIIIGAISVHSVLEDVTSITTTFTTSPLVWAIVGVVALSVATPLLLKWKH